MYAATPFWAFFWGGTPWFSGRCLYYIDWQNWPIKPFTERKLLEKYSEDNGAMGTEHWRLSEIAFCIILTTGFVQILIRNWFTEIILVVIINDPIFITIIAVPVFMNFFFNCLRVCWCSSCHYYWSWFDCPCYCCHFCSIVVINTSLFCSIWHLLCIILFCCCYFFLSLLMLLLLHVVSSCYCRSCCMGIVVFIAIGVGVVAGVVVVVLVVLLPILHHCFGLFNSFLISLSLSSH